jgi:hypothetical protein
MTTVEQGQQELPDLAPIFSGPVRWGFEFAPPAAVQLSPERDHPPARREVATVSAATDAGVDQVTTTLFAAAAISLVLVIIVFAAHVSGLYFVIGLAAAGVSVWATVALRAKTKRLVAQPGFLRIYRLAVLSLFVPPVGLVVQAMLARSNPLLRQVQVPEPKDLAAAQGEHERAVADWQRRISEFEQSEHKRMNEADCWFPVVPSPGSHLICAFGGSSLTWAFAVGTLGASMLGSGRRVFIVDVSRRRSVDGLWELARRDGYPVYPESPPSDTPMLPPLEGTTWESLTTLLSEVSHSAQRDAAVSRRERQEDRSVLREVAGCLDQHAPVSITRLEAALHLVGSAGAPQGDSILSDEEYDRLSVLYNDVQRQHGGVMERVTRLERMLRGLHVLEKTAGDWSKAAGGSDSAASLRVASIDKRADELDSEILSDLFFQLLLHAMRDGTVAADFLILVGADRVSRNSLETLSTYAEREQIPTLLFFEHLRDDAVQVIGGGGAAAVFFALANHHEAQEASNFIGNEYKWIESQRTRAYSESVTRSRGTEKSENVSESHTRGFSGMDSMFHRTEEHGQSWGESLSEAIAKSEEYSSSEQRVREAVIEPEVLMGLPVTGMICVEVQPDGRRVAANVDCHPKINYIPRVSKKPRERPAQRWPTPP